jgi:hypothetical protein
LCPVGPHLGCVQTQRRRDSLAPVDAPLGEMREQYRVNLTLGAATIELLTDEPTLTIPSAELAALGSGPTTIEVRQLGDFAVSRPTQLTLTLS